MTISFKNWCVKAQELKKQVEKGLDESWSDVPHELQEYLKSLLQDVTGSPEKLKSLLVDMYILSGYITELAKENAKEHSKEETTEEDFRKAFHEGLISMYNNRTER